MNEYPAQMEIEKGFRSACTELTKEERCHQIRDLILSPLWVCLSPAQRERWLDQFQELVS